MTSTDTLTRTTPAASEAGAKAPNPFLTGAHSPMTEELTIEDLPVTGTIPAALDGRYLRIGPNPMAADPDNYHWFAGDGMIHGLRLEGGKALWYRNRWVRSEAVTKALGEARTEGPRHIFDTVNTNIIGFAGRTLGLVEAGSTPVEIGETLETLRYTDLDGTLGGSFTAHPHVDPLTGEMHGICYDAMNPAAIRYVVVTAGGQGAAQCRDPGRARADDPRHARSRSASRSSSICRSPSRMETAMAGHPFPYRWNPSHRARVGLLPREGRAEDIIWVEVEPCYVFHAVNAYDARGRQGDPGRRRPRPDVLRQQSRAGFAADRTRALDHRSGGADDGAPDDRRDAAGIPATRRAALRPALSLRLYDGADRRRSWARACSSTISRPARGRSTISGRTGIRASSSSCPRMPTRRRTRAG